MSIETKYQIAICALTVVVILLCRVISVLYSNFRFWEKQALEKSSMVDSQCVKILKMKAQNEGLIKAINFKRVQVNVLKHTNLLLIEWLKSGIKVDSQESLEDKEEIKCGE